MSITEIAIKRPLLISVIFFTLIIFGFLGYSMLNYNLLPKFEAPIISIQTIYKGASSEEVQNNVTKKIEDAVSSIEGVDVVSSSSQENVSMVVVQLKQKINATTAQSDAERKINQIKNDLPDGVDDPVISKFSSSEIPVLRLTTFANIGETELYDLVNQTIKPIISNVEGVGQVRLIGGSEREIEVKIDNEKLQAYNLSTAQVTQMIAIGNMSYPAGNIENADNRYTIRLDAKLASVDELRNLIIRENKNGSKIRLQDVASVTDATAIPTTINRINGRVGLGVEISKQSDANAVEVSHHVKAKLDTIVKQFASKGFRYEVAIDQSTYTLEAATAVTHDLFLAVLIVAFVMLIFLHSFRSSMFILISLPSAMIPTFILMYLMGFSLNLMTLLALSLVVGILVDDSIVVLENIFRHLEMGKDKVTAAIDGRSEIGFTALAITLVDVVVFVPLAMAGGLIGNILREFALVVVFSTLMSLFVSFTLTPLMASRWGKIEVLNPNSLWGKINIWFEHQIEKLIQSYGRILNWALGHKTVVLIVVLSLFGLVGYLGFSGFIGSSFAGSGDRGEFNLIMELDPQATLQQTNRVTKQIEDIILEYPEVTKVFTNVGSVATQMGGAILSPNQADMTVSLVNKLERKRSTDEIGASIRQRLDSIPGIKFSIKPASITGGNQPQIQIVVMGANIDEVWTYAKKVHDIIKKTPGTDYVEYSTKSSKTELQISLNRDKIAKMGLNIQTVGYAIQLAFRGNDQSKFKDKGEEYAINIMYDKGDRKDIKNLENTTIQTPTGATIRLGDVATVSEVQGQSVLERYNRLNSVQILASSAGRPTGTVTADIKEQIDKAGFPSSIAIDYLGEQKNQGDSFGSLGIAMGLGFLLVYLIMVALYESTLYPLVVLFSIPVAIIGAMLALALTMESLSIFGIIGFIMLMGLVAKNGILLVDFTNHLKAQGLQLKEALVEAGKERLRPILMTTVAMISGMLPIALSNGPGSEFKRSMAWVIVGGLTSSLLLTLLVVPTVYYIFDRIKERVTGGKKKKSIVATAEPDFTIET
ncbi:MAG TPA: efflux RND transporter permease subunit [Chitinophagales bacterium]|nr:efflux RND transporter permease subunit [Chitinophagales bacterium]